MSWIHGGCSVVMLAALGWLLGACVPAGADDDDSSGPVPADSVEYYFGTSTISGVTANWTETNTYLVRRSLFPAASCITEELYDTGEGTEWLVDLVVDAAAGTFTLAFVAGEGSYTGTGTLTGAAWAWTEWESISTAADGSTVQSNDSLTDDPAGGTRLVVSKMGRDSVGALDWTAGEVFTEIPESEWLERFAEVPGR